MSGNLYANTFYPNVAAWYNANPALRPAYILLTYGIPNIPKSDYTGVTQGGSLQNDLRETLGLNYNRRPFVSALNFANPTDYSKYLDKLSSVGNATTYPLNSVVLSADKAGLVRNTHVVDSVRNWDGIFNSSLIADCGQ